MTPPASLATALRRNAQGIYCREAAVELLIGNRTWLQRPDFTTAFIQTTAGVVNGQATVAIDWTQAITALLAGRLACYASEHRILRIGASLADGIPVDLQDVLTGLDRANLNLVTVAVQHGGGRRPVHTDRRSETV